MTMKYTDNKTVQIVIALLKGHGINKVVVSPGTTNFMFVGSIQNDPWFEIKSAADERSAAYIACGWAGETGEPVVLSCTGATASRNYLPGLTEAYYRKLPVLALTSINNSALVGSNTPQVIDRSQVPKDAVKMSVNITEVHNDDDARKCIVLANSAMLELTRHGGGPVHINLATKMMTEFNQSVLPSPRIIRRYFYKDELPSLANYKKIAVFIGTHKRFRKEVIQKIEQFCEKYNALVVCDHTSNYVGKFKILGAIIGAQEHLNIEQRTFDLIIDIGEVSGDYYSFIAKEAWRVSEDGEVRDRFKKLINVFEMTEGSFFEYYVERGESVNSDEKNYYTFYKECEEELRKSIPELPFSNIWIAKVAASRLPENSTIHFGILNSLRAWNFFDISDSIEASSNVGGFGIDGGVSTLVGASFADTQKLFFGVVGDLAFFYDMNVLGNRHIGNNLRIMLINNGKGTEFRNYSHPASALGEDADVYIAAAGHYGNKSSLLVRHYAEDLGFKYLHASTKEEVRECLKVFMDPNIGVQPILFEVFTESEKESDALYEIRHIIKEPVVKRAVKAVLGEKNIATIRKKLNI